MLIGAAIAGCGSDDDGSQATTDSPDLAEPQLATCGTEGFQKPKPERHLREGEPTGWQVSYQVSVAQPGETTRILLIEESPELPDRGVTGGQPVTVDEQDVSLRTITEPGVQHVAQWKTAKARYIALSDGPTPARLKRLIPCLP